MHIRARQNGKCCAVINQLERHIEYLDRELCFYKQRYNESLRRNAEKAQITQVVIKVNDEEIRAYRKVLNEIVNFPDIPFVSRLVAKQKARKILDKYLPR